MSDPIVFSFTGIPIGKGRPRTRVVNRPPRKPFATIYTDDATRKYETEIAKIARLVMGSAKPLQGPLSVSLRFRLPIPKSTTKRQRAAILAGEQAYLGAFDIDNLVKAILDPCNTICFEDDKQVVRLFATKVASDKPGVDARIEPLEPQP